MGSEMCIRDREQGMGTNTGIELVGSNCAGTAFFYDLILQGQAVWFTPSPENVTRPRDEKNEDLPENTNEEDNGAGCREVGYDEECKEEEPDCERRVIVYLPFPYSWESELEPETYHVVGEFECGQPYSQQAGNSGPLYGFITDPREAAETYFEGLKNQSEENNAKYPNPELLSERHYCCPDEVE